MPARTPRAAGEQPPEGSEYVTDVLAGNVRAYRLLRRLEQAGVAGEMQLLGHSRWTRQTVSEVERGRRNVTVPELVALVLVLGASVEQLLDPRRLPERRSGPDLAVDVADQPVVSIPVRLVTGLVCSHRVYAEPVWTAERLLKGITWVEGRPELADVGPDGARS